MEISIEEKEKRGKLIIEVLKVKKVAGIPGRFQTTWGAKTALGIYEVMTRIIEKGE